MNKAGYQNMPPSLRHMLHHSCTTKPRRGDLYSMDLKQMAGYEDLFDLGSSFDDQSLQGDLLQQTLQIFDEAPLIDARSPAPPMLDDLHEPVAAAGARGNAGAPIKGALASPAVGASSARPAGGDASSDLELSDGTQETSSRGPKRKFSKNLASERKRRQKLNEKLYSLRAIVPKITKMDKASIMADAIDYVGELKGQVMEMQREIRSIESDDPSNDPSPQQEQQQQVRACSSLSSSSSSAKQVEAAPAAFSSNTLEVDVEKVDDCRTCLVRFTCNSRALMDLVTVLESLDMEVISANIISFQDQIFSSYITKVRDEELMKKDKLRGLVWNAMVESNRRVQVEVSE